MERSADRDLGSGSVCAAEGPDPAGPGAAGNATTRAACRCGHGVAAHEHYRPGSECALCPGCGRYRPARPWLELARRLAGAATAFARGRGGSPG